MESLNGYIGLISLIGFAAVIVLAVIIIVGQIRLKKSVAGSKFATNGFEEVDAETGKRSYTVIVSNRSVNDACVSALGVVSGLKHFDFTKRLREETGERSIVVTPRMPVKLSLEPGELEKPIFSDLGGGRFRRVKIYVIDSSGNLFVQRAADFEKSLKTGYKKYAARRRAAEKAAKKAEKLRENYEFLQGMKAAKEEGKPSAFKDKIKIVLLGRANEQAVNAAEEDRARAEYLASLYTEESVAEAERAPKASVCRPAETASPEADAPQANEEEFIEQSCEEQAPAVSEEAESETAAAEETEGESEPDLGAQDDFAEEEEEIPQEQAEKNETLLETPEPEEREENAEEREEEKVY